MDETDWCASVEFEIKRVAVGDLVVQVCQMEELSVAASLFMLAEMDANVTEISGTRLWTGSHFLSRVQYCAISLSLSLSPLSLALDVKRVP